MKFAPLLILSLCVLSLPTFADEPKAKASVIAKFSEDSLSDGSRKFFVYSKEELKTVEWRFTTIQNWHVMPVAQKTDDLFVNVTDSYVQMDTGYYIRGTRKDGTQFTNVLTVKVGNGAPEIAVTVYTEEKQKNVEAPEVKPEKKAEAKLETPYPKTLKYAQDCIGCRVGNGGCNSLAAGRDHIGTVNPRGQITGKIVPGSVIELRNFSISGPDGATWSSRLGQHYAVVESYDPETSNITILHQNWANGNLGGQYVRRDVLTLNKLWQGSIIVRSGDHD